MLINYKKFWSEVSDEASLIKTSTMWNYSWIMVQEGFLVSLRIGFSQEISKPVSLSLEYVAYFKRLEILYVRVHHFQTSYKQMTYSSKS